MTVIQFNDRNSVLGFSERVLRNLDYILSAQNDNLNAVVHPTTQLITSLLGLIIFPHEKSKIARNTYLGEYNLEELISKKGWPRWQFTISKSTKLSSLVKSLRDAIAHRGVEFTSNHQELSEVNVIFRTRPDLDKPYNWQATINAAELLKFIRLLDQLIRELEKKQVGIASADMPE